tara:strand:- start:39190 stop:39513 length:324 start_codon:yes stop_codon:yes gene_type:complete
LSKEISIKVKDREGKIRLLTLPIDMNLNLMEAIKLNNIQIDGRCGGIALCASCQCYILSNHILIEKSENETAMLSEALNVKPNSRLVCQLILSKDMDGLEIELAQEE